MRYVMIFLAVLVVLLLMIAFMFLVIRQVSDRVTGQVNGRYMRELSVFDRLYEEKKKKLEELEEKERLYGVNLMKKDAPAKNPAKVQTVAETPAAGLELPPASTGQTDFGEAYRNVRNEFAVDRSAEIRGDPFSGSGSDGRDRKSGRQDPYGSSARNCIQSFNSRSGRAGADLKTVSG